MVDISGPRVEPIADPESGAQEQAYQKPLAKAAAAGKPAPPKTPEIGAANEEEKPQLDEMA